MSSEDTNDTPVGITHVPVSDDSAQTPHEAMNSLLDFRRKREAGEPPEEAPQPAADPEPESPQGSNAAPAEEATSEQPTETTEPAEVPPIEPPRSWKSEDKEFFKTLPREAQEKVASREQERETHLRRTQNELAEQRKVVEQARQQYEQALPALLQTLHEQQQGEFHDVKTMADVEKLAREDWPRYALWDAQQKKIAAVQQEVKASEERQKTEFTQKWTEYTTAEDAAFMEKAPEMATEKGKELANASIDLLKSTGFTQEDLAKLWSGQASLSLRDHRAQLLILKAAKYDAAQKAVPTKVVKVVPPVQRPGSTAVKQSDDDVRVKTLADKLDNSGSLKDAMAFLNAKRSAAKR